MRNPVKLSKPKEIKIAKLEAHATYDKVKAVKYEYHHKYHLQNIKRKQNANAIKKVAKNIITTIHLPKIINKIKEWSFKDPNKFKYYTILMYADKRNFKHDKDMNHENYKSLSWGLINLLISTVSKYKIRQCTKPKVTMIIKLTQALKVPVSITEAANHLIVTTLPSTVNLDKLINGTIKLTWNGQHLDKDDVLTIKLWLKHKYTK